jgi:amidase
MKESDGLWQLSATLVGAMLKDGKISAAELTQACVSRIDTIDGVVKAFITVDRDGAMEAAKAADARRSRGGAMGPLHGLPVAIKDVVATKGLRTTYGSLVYRDNIPSRDDHFVERARAAGGIVIGKTNTPEFAFGAVCQNRLLGPTLNPYDLTRTSGGSSGGAAVGIALGMVPLAHGTDFGGSCRLPASFCGVFGLRPTTGRIANPEKDLLWNDLSLHGMLARTVEDIALFLSATSGSALGDPTSAGRGSFSVPEFRAVPISGLKLAFKPDLGIGPIDGKVRRALSDAADRIVQLYPDLDEECPDFEGAMEAFLTLRGPLVRHELGPMLQAHRDALTPSVIWNIERGIGVTAEDYLRAEYRRTQIFQSAAAFFGKYDFLLSTTAGIPAFRNDESEVLLIDNKPMKHILDYGKPTVAISLIGLPALSVPCGFTEDGLPVGLQIVGRPFDEARLCQFAYTLQELAGFAHRWPVDPT